MEFRIDNGLLESCQLTRNDAMRLVDRQGTRRFLDARILDANETVFFAREIEFIKKRAYDVLYPEFKGPFFCPVSNEANTGSEKITYDQYDSTGEATVINNEATDYQDVDISKKQFSNSVKTIGSAVQWTLQDLRRFAMAAKSGRASAGRSFTQRKTDAGIKAIKQKEERIIAEGDAKSDLVGFYNNTNLQTVIFDADGDSNKARWESKDEDKIIRDFNKLVNAVQSTTLSVHLANTVILSSNYYTILNTKRIGNTNTSVLNYLLDVHKDKGLIVAAYDWINVGLTNMERLIAYQRGPDILTQEIPQPLEVFPPQQLGTSFRVILRERHGGVQIYYPKACVRAQVSNQ